MKSLALVDITLLPPTRELTAHHFPLIPEGDVATQDTEEHVARFLVTVPYDTLDAFQPIAEGMEWDVVELIPASSEVSFYLKLVNSYSPKLVE